MKTTYILKNLVISILVIIASLFLKGCGPAEHSETSSIDWTVTAFSQPATFKEIQNNILQPKCYSCHSVGYNDLTSYEGVVIRVKAGSPATSLLYQRVANFSMPLLGGPLSPTEIEAIASWISSGAQNN